MPGTDNAGRRELLFCAAVAASIVFVGSIAPLAFEQLFDSDQAVCGLMTKHYWDAYAVTFLSRERVIVASTGPVRITAYQTEVDQHASEAVTLQRGPCDTGVKVATWCVIGPPGR